MCMPSSVMPVFYFAAILLPAIVHSQDDPVVAFGGKQKFYETTFDRDAIESSIESQTLSPTSTLSSVAEDGFHTLSSGYLPADTAWMSSTPSSSSEEQESSYQPSHVEQPVAYHPSEQKLSAQSEQQVQSSQVKNGDYVLVFSHAIEIPLSATARSVSMPRSASQEVTQSSLTNDEPIYSGQDTRPVTMSPNYGRQPGSNYPQSDFQQAPSQPMVRMYSYMAPVTAPSNQESTIHDYIPHSTYDAFYGSSSNDKKNFGAYEQLSNPNYEAKATSQAVAPQPKKNLVSNEPKYQSFYPMSSYNVPALPVYTPLPQTQYETLPKYEPPIHVPTQTVTRQHHRDVNLQQLRHLTSRLTPFGAPQQVPQAMAKLYGQPMAAPPSQSVSSSNPAKSYLRHPLLPRLLSHMQPLFGGRLW